ncbi:MAG: aminotransferase class V-fold PLP-dependent enzyme [Acidobacteriota bacterium]|nr:selenocysteine synthase [Acidobacteriota bacterium]MCH2279940.1 aminotransferase class V-fold PLP-dependent enzyme [Vicinamibacterales bacterium]MEC7767823.1 aminotransferase class V-fold PLP-dependent enzyme [Acidobacteriota bacterium]
MKHRPNDWSRRRFLASTGAAPVAGLLASKCAPPPEAPAEIGDVYERLGVRPFINAAGTYTALTASLMPAEVRAAMADASQQFVSLSELHTAAGTRIAELVGAEAALVTTGCAAALTQATAACVCGTDQNAIRQVPNTTGLKQEVIIQRSHRFGYDHAIRNVGVELVEVETRAELEAAVTDQTAMLFFLNVANTRGQIQREEFAEIGRQAEIPTLIDAAADLPPADNLRAFTRMGFDLVGFSGGKGLRGPQCSGLLLGRKDLVEAAYLNGSPHGNSIGRIAKVGKEEIVGLTRAVELYLKKDHEAEWAEWEARVSAIIDAVTDIPSVEGKQFVPEIANEVPHARITWDPTRIALTRDDVAQALREGHPRIEPRPSAADASRLELGVWMMEAGDHKVVAGRVAEILAQEAGA